MDFKLTDEQRLIRKAARDFSSKELAPNAREWEETATFSSCGFRQNGPTGLYGSLCARTIRRNGGGKAHRCPHF